MRHRVTACFRGIRKIFKTRPTENKVGQLFITTHTTRYMANNAIKEVGAGADAGSGTGAGSSAGASLGARADDSVGTRVGTDSSVTLCTGSAHMGADTTIKDVGAGAGAGSGAGAGAGLGAGAGAGAIVDARVGVDIGATLVNVFK